MTIMRTEVNEAKFVELLVYAVHALSHDDAAMATRLNKLLYFCDFAHVRRTGDPITGQDYEKLPGGPAPRVMSSTRDRLVAEGVLSQRVRTDAFGYNHHVFSAAREADLSIFSESERETIQDVVAELVEMSARQISDLSHEDAGWQMVGVGESIPYSTAYIGTGTEVPDRLQSTVEATAAELTEELGPRLAR